MQTSNYAWLDRLYPYYCGIIGKIQEKAAGSRQPFQGNLRITCYSHISTSR
jgi:hypothetical protein